MNTPMGDQEKITPTGPQHEALYQDMIEVLKKHAQGTPGLSPTELLAIASNIVGKLVATQDKKLLTPDQAMQIVILNIQHGNQEALRQMKDMMPPPGEHLQ